MSGTATVDAIRSALDGLIAGCEKLDARIDAMTKNDADGVRIVYNKLLGGWYVVRGPHQSPLNGRFNSKEEAQAWLNARRGKDSAARADADGPSDVQLQALRNYAQKHGHTWKRDLLHDWETGHAEGELQQVRNQFGPSWLVRFRFGAMAKNDAGISGAQIETLKREYGRIKGIDPNSESYRKLIVLLDRLGQEELKQLSTAGVPFVSKLALNRVKKDSAARHDYITESGGKYTVHAESGKPMGAYGSKGEAEKRLREIEYFKHRGDAAARHDILKGQLEVVPYAHWLSDDGRKASIHGAVPWRSNAEKAHWKVVESGFTIYNKHENTYGMGRPPFKTHSEAEAYIKRVEAM